MFRCRVRGMTERATTKATGTVWIVIGVVLLALALLQVVTAPAVIETGDGASIAGKIFGVVACAGLGAWALIAGLTQRKRSTQA